MSEKVFQDVVAIDMVEEAVSEVLDFSSKVILSSLSGESVNVKEIAEIRLKCCIIDRAGLYSFDLDCNDYELLEQIQDFANSGLSE